ncbi:hypothetical protein LCGC14_3004330 [marine sediment metagenome]|uniref:Uncharacterized protein n=2 Tax=marine sediment metagenome TaxID=412755 RepID=A0A0F8X0L7_9ZZZZ
MTKKEKEKTLYDAYKKGYLDGTLAVVYAFTVPDEDIQDKFKSKEVILEVISKSYHKWMGFLHD